MERIEKNRTAFLAAASKTEWTITFEDERGIQIRKKPKYSEGIMVTGLLLLFFGIGLGIMFKAANENLALPLLIFGIGILVWIYGIIDLLMNDDYLLYIMKTEFENEDMTSVIERLAQDSGRTSRRSCRESSEQNH